MLNDLHARRNGLLCAFAVAVCVLLTNPVFNMGVNDDFSYTKSAFDFARTGHILYNGWSAPIVGWQILWGGLFAKLFGYSFTAVRLSMLPVAMGAVYLLYQILARFGANARNAAIGALTMGLSPLFIPLAASFMTDVSALFCILLCLRMCQRALQASSDRAVVVWLCSAAVLNVIGGTVRQIAWLGALVMVPSAAWLLRKRPWIPLTTAVLWVLSAASIVVCVHWFQQQPYSVAEKMWQGPIDRAMLGHAAGQLKRLFLELLLFVLPLLVASFSRFFQLSGKYRLPALACMTVMVAAIFFWRETHHSLENALAPWLFNIVTQYGMVTTGEVGTWPVILGKGVRLFLTLIVELSAVAWITILIALLGSRPRPPEEPLRSKALLHLREAAVLTVLFTLSYLATVLPRATYYGLIDRYILPVWPVLIIFLVLYYQGRVREDLPAISIVVLGIFAAYAVAGTHDRFSMARARLRAAEELERAGVPRTLIHGSFEFDSWTQVEEQGFMREHATPLHPGVSEPVPDQNSTPKECRYLFAIDLTAVHPKYIVLPIPQSCFFKSPFSAVAYSTWLPPYGRKIYIQQALPDYDWTY